MSSLTHHIETVVEDLAGSRHVIVVSTRVPSGPQEDRRQRLLGARRRPPSLTGLSPDPLYAQGSIRPAVAYAGFVGFATLAAARDTPRRARSGSGLDRMLSRWAVTRSRSVRRQQRLFELLLVATILTFFM